MDNHQSTYSLSELMGLVQSVLLSSFDRTYWVTVEIGNISKANGRGHLYFEFVEKDAEQILAKARAVMWAGMQSRQILDDFERVSRQQLKIGMKILAQVRVTFHAVYGFTLQVLDIDGTYSLGEMERQKQAAIQQLEQEGLLHFNKQFVLPAVLQRIAVISSEQAAGYQDFYHQLLHNEYAYRFEIELFPALMQGEQAPQSIMGALKAVEAKADTFDAICILRGGGSNIDLVCFNDYELCAMLAQTTLPILSGIGHERDTSIVDMVAHTRLKTPTAVAEFILSHNLDFENTIGAAFQHIAQSSKQLLHKHSSYLEKYAYHLHDASRQRLQTGKDDVQIAAYHLKDASRLGLRQVRKHLSIGFSRLEMLSKNTIKIAEKEQLNPAVEKLYVAYQSYIRGKKNNLDNAKDILLSLHKRLDKEAQYLGWMQQILQISDPEQWLQKGLAMVKYNGKIISYADKLSNGQHIEIEMQDAVLSSIIENIKQK